MRIHSIAWGTGLLGATAISAVKSGLPVDKVYGVNLGSWLLSEPWMFPNEWKTMGGEICDDCSKCAMSEYALTQKLGQDEANKVFERHWSTWFTQENVDAIAEANLNTVRIPLGYWIIDKLVDRSTEYYPQGGMKYLKKGLRMLKAKGINVILDFHALPGVASANQMFAGRCTSDVQFYTEKNYHRALVWTAIMTAISHTDPDFSSVFSIEAINEPEMDYNKTPGLGDYEKKFVTVVRLVELALGIKCHDADTAKLFPGSYDGTSTDSGILAIAKKADSVIAAILNEAVSCLPDVISQLGLSSLHLKRALGEDYNNGVHVDEGSSEDSVGAIPHGSSLERHNAKRRLHRGRGISASLLGGANRQCLTTSFMNKDWQYNNPANPADAAIGPQFYDAHLYFSFGGVADPNAESYMRTICNTDRVTKAIAVDNRPLVFGEWSLATNFNASEQFIHDWSDAQRYIYAGQADGWIFWSFKIEPGSVYIPAWSYFDALAQGYFNNDPSKLTNPDVCVPWLTSGTST